MRQNKDTVIPWGCVFKITFPNGKIYVGSDTARTARFDYFKYFGTPIKSKAEMLDELGKYLNKSYPYIVKKEILYAQENVRIGDVLKKEQRMIEEFKSREPNIGYNR